MQRRAFLTRILQLAGLAAAPSLVGASPIGRDAVRSETVATPAAPTAPASPAAPAASTAPLLLQASPLAGFRYHAGEACWARLRRGAALTLVREPDNPHDTRAIRVDWEGSKLGYVPRLENATLASLMDRGHPLEARILALREDPNPWRRVELEVFLADGSHAPDA